MNRYIVISLMVVLLALTSCSMVAEHEWSPWSVIKEATCEETGLRKATCLICDAEKEETIPKHAHTLNAHNKCSECGKYQIAEDYGEGDTLSRKLQIAISDISSEGAIVALHEGTYNFGEIGAQTISEKGVTVEGVRGKNNENTAVFTLPSGTGEAIKATGEDFSLKNVTINAAGSSSGVLTLTGNNAVITNTDINLSGSSKDAKALGDITDGQSVTLDSVNINGGGITSSGDLVVKNSTIETSSGGDALDIKGGTVSLTGSTLEGNVKSEKTIESITITGSSINTGNTNGTNTLKGKTVTIDSSNLGGSSDITATGDAIISGSNLKSGGNGSTTTKITASTVSLDSTTVGGSVTVEATKKTSVTGSSINEGKEDGKLSLISPVISIAGTKLAGDISLDAGSSSTANKITIEESSVNDSGSGKLTVTGGTLAVDKSSLAGDITIEKSVSGAKITSSTIDTSAGSNALKTGTDITIEGSTVTKGSGLYVIPTTGTTVKVSISSSTSDTGEEITNQTMRNIVSKELTDDEVNKGDVIYPWTSGGSCSVDDAVVPESLFFTLQNNDGTKYTFQADKGVEITLSSYVQSRGSGYVGPTFYSNTSYTNEIKKIKLTGDNKYIITSPSTDTSEHSGNIATKWEYKVSFNLDGGTGSTATATTKDNGKLTITNPTKANCTFAGWYDASDSEKKVISTAVKGSDNTTSVTLTKPATLEAKWGVELIVNGENKGIKDIGTVVAVASLGTPTKDGCEFEGWYTDSDLSNKVTGNLTLTENTTLYPKFVCKVTFDAKGGTFATSSGEKIANGLKVEYGKTIAADQLEISKTVNEQSLHFGGWYTDEEYSGTQVESGTKIEKGMKLYARWQVAYTVNGGETQYIDEGKSLNISDLPESKTEEKTWIKSVTWYRDSVADENLLSGSVTMNAGQNDLKLVSKIECYTPTLNWSDSTRDDSRAVAGQSQTSETAEVSTADGKLSLPTLTSTNYDFVGWVKEDGTEVSSDTVVDRTYSSLTLKPKWTIKRITMTIGDTSCGLKAGDTLLAYVPDKGYNIYKNTKEDTATTGETSETKGRIASGDNSMVYGYVTLRKGENSKNYSGKNYYYFTYSGKDLFYYGSDSYESEKIGDYSGATACEFSLNTEDKIEIVVNEAQKITIDNKEYTVKSPTIEIDGKSIKLGGEEKTTASNSSGGSEVFDGWYVGETKISGTYTVTSGLEISSKWTNEQ